MKSLFAKKDKKRLIIDLIILACIVLLAASLWLWWGRIVMNPDRALSGAISNNLQTKSITKQVNQEEPTGKINQTTYLSFFNSNLASETKTVVSQGSGSNPTVITTETIGTPNTDFVRYTEAQGTENLPGASKLNELIGIWAKTEQNLEQDQQVTFLNENLFGIVTFGDFDEAERAKLLDLINQKNIYKYTTVERAIENKRPVYVYTLSINPVDLIGFVKEYMKLSGVDSSGLDPEQYKGVGELQINLTVDILSRQVTKVEYPTGRIENYSAHNLFRPIDLPGETITIEELQKRLQEQQQEESSEQGA